MTSPLVSDAVAGCLLGQAVGDAMGLPAENLSPRRLARLFPSFDRPRFVFGYGMGSDDTEHACMTAQALLRSGKDVGRFRQSLAWRLRWWLLGMPAGIGLATLQSCLKLWLGFPLTHSGVFSAGNGPAMRAAILGVAFFDNWTVLNEHVKSSTRLTHTDPKAEYGALAIALAALNAIRTRGDAAPNLQGFQYDVDSQIPGRDPAANELRGFIERIEEGLATNHTVQSFAESLGCRRGVSGYIYTTVPVAIYAFFRHPDDYRTAVESVIRLGGDTDTVAALTGALVGARVGKSGIPEEWLHRFADWPRSAAWIEQLSERLATGAWLDAPQSALPLAWWAVPIRNLLFFLIVLGHIGRRLLPPY